MDIHGCRKLKVLGELNLTLSSFKKRPQIMTEAMERTRSKHRAGIANECEWPMRGGCEV